MHSLTSAYQAWLKTEEGKSALDGRILFHPGHQKFLNNRIYKAFHAGAATQEMIDKAGLRTGILVPDPGYHSFKNRLKPYHAR